MALTPGTRLGPYAITAQIGVGGMGEVCPGHRDLVHYSPDSRGKVEVQD